MRLFSIIQWHHFAYMIISLALLGYGASGTFLTLYRGWLLPRFAPAFLINLFLFSISTVLCFLFAQQLPFSPQELLWGGEQMVWLALIYLLLALPFFFAANCIGLTFSRFTDRTSTIYAADLIGAGSGSVAIVALLFLIFAEQALLLIGSISALTLLIAGVEFGHRALRFALPILFFALMHWSLPGEWSTLMVSPYKGLSQLLEVSGSHLIEERSSPLGQLSIVESRHIPLRHAPGLSLLSSQLPPEQIGVFTDGDGLTAISRQREEEGERWVDHLTSALPYHLNRPESLLILGAGGGSGILQGQLHGVEKIDAVELNPQMAALLQSDYADYSGNLLKREGTTLHTAEARGFISNSRERYDQIQISLLDSYSASSAGLHALSESYLYTVEAVTQYLSHLSTDGFLAITRWVKLPPRDTLKLFATARTALQSMGVEAPSQRLILIRSWQTSTLLVKNSAVTTAEIDALKRFCQRHAFDVSYYPGMDAAEANRYNQLKTPYLFQGATALLGGEAEAFIRDYKFNLTPATDDRPYFFHFFRWEVLPEILALRGQGGISLLETGYLILIATLVQAIGASLLLILLPLFLLRRREGSTANGTTVKPLSSKLVLRNLTYFFMLGLAFLFIEMAFIQKFILFLHHPLYAVSVVLAAFLIFAGLGSYASKRLSQQWSSRRVIQGAIALIAVVGISYTLFLNPLLNTLSGMEAPIRIITTVALIAPLALCMGLPFPLGLMQLGVTAPELVPWVWGVNGCASVISAILATLLAIHFGFTTVVLAALVCYGLAALMVDSSHPSIEHSGTQ